MWQPLEDLGKNNLFIKKVEIEPMKKSISSCIQTPIKQVQNSQIVTSSQDNFNFNFYFGHLFSPGKLPSSQVESLENVASNTSKKEVNFFPQSSFDKGAFDLSSFSDFRDLKFGRSNENFNYQNQLLPMGRQMNSFKGNTQFNSFIPVVQNNPYEKKNLSSVFHQLQENNQKKVSTPEKQKFKVEKTEPSKKSSKIFSLYENQSSQSKNSKFSNRKRYRKNQEQLKILANYFKEKETWNKEEIRQISLDTGLKVPKVYKWLWDQKNKKLTKSMFYVKK